MVPEWGIENGGGCGGICTCGVGDWRLFGCGAGASVCGCCISVPDLCIRFSLSHRNLAVVGSNALRTFGKTSPSIHLPPAANPLLSLHGIQG